MKTDRLPILHVLVGAALLSVVIFQFSRIFGHVGSDFKIFHNAASRFGLDPLMLYSRDSVDTLQGFLYPPPAIVLFRGFSFLDVSTAYALFLVVAYGSAIASALTWMRAIDKDSRFVGFDGADKAIGILLAVAAGPVFSAAGAGQVDTVVLFICGLYALMLTKERFFLAGFVLSLGFWIKIYPALLLIYVFSGKSRITLVPGFLFGLIAVPVLLVAWVPMELYTDYFSNYLPHLSKRTIINIYNQSFSAFLVRMDFPMENSLNSYDAVQVASAIRMLVLSAGAAFVLYAIVLMRRKNMQMIALAMAISAVSWLAPLGWGHAYVYSLPLMMFLWGRCKNAPGGVVPILFGTAYVAMLLPAYHRFSWLSGVPHLVANAVYSRYLFFVVVFVLAAALAIRQHAHFDGDATDMAGKAKGAI